ncbi:MAG: DeoR/GlpR transcriptional regulator [Rhodobacteraceae bacterium]|nr:DeoR/GlpR transcriptional regulator [Paracoccaceae bacterium]
MKELLLHPQLKVHELADRLVVSQETIRRDLTALANEGRLERTFGGAVSIATTVPGINERRKLMVEERDRISACAAALIEPNDVIMVGGGSTTLRFALKLASLEFPFTVVTHSLPLAMTVGLNRNAHVELLPGRLNPDEGLTAGINAIYAMNSFSAHKAFVGASGINDLGLHALLEPGEVYRTMINAAQRSFVLADSSKFGARALSRYQNWAAGMTLITDTAPAPDLVAAIEAAGAILTIA